MEIVTADMKPATGDLHQRQSGGEQGHAYPLIGIHHGMVLIIAYHFPPHVGSSGHLRPLKYCRYLPNHGWTPTVLTVHPRAYEHVGDSQLKEVPSALKVVRAFALDTRKHLSFRSRYLLCTSLPDRWVSWCLGAVPAGLFTMYRDKTEVIMTTFPIASAVLIGYVLHRLTSRPWVVDFRDSMTEDNYPPDPRTRRVFRWLEKMVVRHASRLIFTAPSAKRMYLQRYPELQPERCIVITNGYDEEDFAGLHAARERDSRRRLRLQHSGLIYPQERNPVPFFSALSRLKKENRIRPSFLSVELRACGNEERYRKMIQELAIDDLVSFPPALPYREALQDMCASDMLLLLQGATCNHQIPAKVYEYLRVGKPILALTYRNGDTAALLEECGGATIIDLDDEEAIYQGLPEALASVLAGDHPIPREKAVARYSRENQARELARCLSEVIAGHPEGASVPGI